MKFVFVKAEVAHALSMTEADFEIIRPKLERHGFPMPIQGIEDRWSIMDVINWVNRAQSHNASQQSLDNIQPTQPSPLLN